MRWSLAATVALCLACGDGGNDAANKLQGNWIFTSAATGFGFGVAFKPDDHYTVYTLNLTSDASAAAQVENGTFSASDTEIVTVPKESTCPGPAPVDTVKYIFAGPGLVITAGDKVISLVRDTAPVETSFVLSLGCFQPDGTFVPSGLQPVSN